MSNEVCSFDIVSKIFFSTFFFGNMTFDCFMGFYFQLFLDA